MKSFESWARDYFCMDNDEHVMETLTAQAVDEATLVDCWNACAQEHQETIKQLRADLAYAVASLEQLNESIETDLDEDGEFEAMRNWCKDTRKRHGLGGEG